MPVEAPAAPVAAPAAVPAAPASPPPAGGPSQVPASSVPGAIELPSNVKKGTAKERLYQALEKTAKPPFGQAADEPPAPRPGADEPPVAPKPGDEPPADPNAPPAPAPKPGDAPQGKKVSPWKLVDEHKAARAAAETRLAELQKLVPDPAAIEAQRKDFETVTKKAQDLEKLVSFLDYSQSEEFKTKYVAPYEKAWQDAAAELQEIHWTDPQTQEKRIAQPQDLLTLVNLPLGEARSVAEATFGPFADDVMSWRGKIRDLFKAQGNALATAKEQAANWRRTQGETSKAAMAKVSEAVGAVWKEANEAITKDPTHGKWLTPVDGNTEINSRLERGFKFVDEAFKVNPLDPNLSPEDRAKGVRMQAALRNRAGAYGRLTYEISQLQKQVGDLTKQLSGYKASTPPANPSAPGNSAPGGPKGMARLHAELAKLAK